LTKECVEAVLFEIERSRDSIIADMEAAILGEMGCGIQRREKRRTAQGSLGNAKSN